MFPLSRKVFGMIGFILRDFSERDVHRETTSELGLPIWSSISKIDETMNDPARRTMKRLGNESFPTRIGLVHAK